MPAGAPQLNWGVSPTTDIAAVRAPQGQLPARSVRHDLRWGIRGAFNVAVVYAFVATCQRVVRGTRAFDHHGVTYPAVLTSYVLIGLAAGALVGLCRPLLVHGAGRLAVGLLVGALVASGFTLVVAGPPACWDFDEYAVMGIVAPTVGVVLAREFRKDVSERRAG